MYRPAVLVSAALLAVSSSQPAAQARFEAGVDLVAMDVCATDREGRPVNFAPEDFAIFDNGVRQEAVLLSPGVTLPLAVTLLVDSSESMHGGLLERARRAAASLIDRLPDNSLVEVMAFNDRPSVLYSMGVDRRAASAALTHLSAVGGTALYHAVIVALAQLTALYVQIASDVRNLYRVGYVPSPLVRDGAWHQVQIRPLGRDIVFRTRSGYFAPAS